jgi:WD40 repeat protein
MWVSKVKGVLALILTLGILAGGAGVCARQVLSIRNPAGASSAVKTQVEECDPKVEAEKPARLDRHGDPLPPGALARLGTVRFRHRFWLADADFSRDGKMLITGSGDRQIIFWDSATGKEQRRLDTEAHGHLHSLSISSDGEILAVGYDDGIRLFDLATGKLVREWKSEHTESVLFSPDGKTLASQDQEHLHLWDPATGKKRHAWKVESVEGFAFSPDGQQFACWDRRSTLRLWNVATGREEKPWQEKGCHGIAWSPDGKTIATLGSLSLSFRDRATGRERVKVPFEESLLRQIAYLPDGSALAALDQDAIHLYDPATGKRLRSFPSSSRDYRRMRISADGRKIVVLSHGKHAPDVLDITGGRRVGPAEGHRDVAAALAFNRDGRILFSGTPTGDGSLRVWDPATGKELRRTGEGANSLALSPDGRLLAVGEEAAASLRDPATGKELRSLKQPRVVQAVSFSTDGRWLAACSRERTRSAIHTWDLNTGEPGVVFDESTNDPPFRTPLSPDGKLIAGIGWQGGGVRVWDAHTGRQVQQFYAGENSARGLAFSPDGRALAVGGWYRPISLWDPITGKLLGRFDDVRGTSVALAFLPDGRTLVSGGDAIRLWETATGRLRATLTWPGGDAWELAVSRDGRMIASAHEDTTILTWDLTRAWTILPWKAEVRWAELAGNDAAKAYQAIRSVSAAPKEAVPFLRERLKPVPVLTPADRERFGRLVADLDSDEFEVRRQAEAALEKQAAALEPLLRQALAGKPKLEVRRRLERRLAPLEGWSPNRLRQLRAVEALEYAGSNEAKRLLEELAGGAPDAWLTREAKASRERLKSRP